MKILLISSNSSSAGGGEEYLVYLAKGLKNLGEEVIVLLSDRPYMDTWEDKFNTIRIHVKRADLKGLRERPLRFLQSINDKRQIGLIASLCSQLKPDIIHVNQQYDADGLDYLMGALRYGKAPVISMIHMPMSLTKHPRPKKSVKTWLVKIFLLDKLKTSILKIWYEKHEFTKIFPTETMKNEFATVYGKSGDLHVIIHGIDTDRIPYPAGQIKTHTMGFCGRLNPQKDVFLLINAWLNARKRGLKSKLLLIGDGILRKKIEEKLRKKSPEGSWKVTGWVRNPQDYMAQVDLLLVTSKFEGFPIAILEATCAGKCCLCTDFPGASEMAKKIPSLKVVKSKNPDILAQAILEHNDKNICAKEKIEKIRTFFSCTRMAADTIALYKRRAEIKKPKLAVVWPDFNFYHIARFRALHEKLGNRLLGIELIGGVGDDETTQWRYSKRDGLPIVTLFPHKDMRGLSRKALGRAIVDKLKEWRADIIFVNGYSTPELRIVIDWAYKNNKRCFTFFESKKDDFKRFFISEYFKKRIVTKLSGAICGGKLHREYLTELGMPEENIFFGYNVIDNNFFKEKSFLAQENAELNRKEYGLPKNYFVTSSRLIKKKNLSRLLDAYKAYRKRFNAAKSRVSSETDDKIPWGLVLCGAGTEGAFLEKKVKREKIKGVNFAGPKEPKELALHYGLASAFILASTREQWGLAINEAMASGLPILATNIAGASRELVEDGINGYKFNPLDKNRLSELMLDMTCLDEAKRLEMRKNNQERISSYSPEYFAENIIKAIEKW